MTSTLLYYTQYCALLNWLADSGIDLSNRSTWSTYYNNVGDLFAESGNGVCSWVMEGCYMDPEYGYYYPAATNGAGYVMEDGSVGAPYEYWSFRPALYINNI